jgi:hypothetical protein
MPLKVLIEGERAPGHTLVYTRCIKRRATVVRNGRKTILKFHMA